MSSAENSPSAQRSLVVAVDGTSGSGKSSTSRGVAVRLGLRYLDTGAMFRAMTWWLLREGVDVRDGAAVAAVAGRPRIESGTDPLAPTITVAKPMIDSFLSASGKFLSSSGEAEFKERIVVSTTEKWGSNAEDAIRNQLID